MKPVQDRAEQRPYSRPIVSPDIEPKHGNARESAKNQIGEADIVKNANPVWKQYLFAFSVFAATSLLNISLLDLIGYQASALVYLLSIVLVALFASRGPIIFGTTLTAAGWGILAPPRYSFHIASFYDKMMMLTYFVVAITIGELMARLRAHREEELKAKLVAESERLSRTLLNSVSHELRTPIAAILNAASELRASEELAPKQHKLAGEIESASARLNRVVQSLLSAARLQSGQIRPKMEWCDVSELVRVASKGVAAWTEEHPIQKTIASGLPFVKMDFILMEQAIANLLVNAAMHTPRGTVIEIGVRQQEKELVVDIADRGPGLPADQIEKIFELFHRLPDAKPGGTGLGLTIVRGFVEAQGGCVRAANRPGGGAVFTITLPMSEKFNLPEEIS